MVIKEKKIKFFLLFIFFLFPFFTILADWKNQPDEILVDDFSKTKAVGDFPRWWETYPFQLGKAKRVYKISEENGERFIQAMDDQDISIPIFKDFYWNLGKYPILKWKWRAISLPKGAKENSRSTNDSACGVYIAFGRTSGVALKYVWSSTLPIRYVWEKKPGKFYVIVLESGRKSLNRWKKEGINILEDYQKYFSTDPSKNPSGIGIMTDGNATHSKAACDYAKFVISKNSL